MKMSHNTFIPKTDYYKVISFIFICIISTFLLWSYFNWPTSTKLFRVLFNAEVIDFSNDVLTVKGLPTNTEFTRETYRIKITDDIFLKDWETDHILEWGVVNEYKYVVVEYCGSEKIKGNSYLKGVMNIYCNADKRIF
jgi:hypothetical protein